MLWAKNSTSATLIVGPILDASGVEYTSAVIGDLSLSKNGATLTALASAATLTHIANGQYTLVLTTGNTDTLGRAQITCNKSTYQMPMLELMVIPATVFDALVTNAANTTGGLIAATAAVSAAAGYIGSTGAQVNGSNVNTLAGHDPGGTIASTTNITGGTITTVTNLTNAPTSGDLTATMKASVTAAVPSAATIAAATEAAILNEGDATALLAAIAAKVEEFLINEGDATATLAAIGAAVRTALGTELTRITTALPSVAPGSSAGGLPTCGPGPTGDGTIVAQHVRLSTSNLDSVAASVRDVSNATPAAGSLGEKVNTAAAGADPDAIGAAVAADVVDALAGSSIAINRSVVNGTIKLYPNCDHTVANGNEVTITLPAGAWPNVDTATSIKLGVTKLADNSGGFAMEYTARDGDDSAAQTVTFEPMKDSQTNAIDPAYDYGFTMVATWAGGRSAVAEGKVIIGTTRVPLS